VPGCNIGGGVVQAAETHAAVTGHMASKYLDEDGGGATRLWPLVPRS